MKLTLRTLALTGALAAFVVVPAAVASAAANPSGSGQPSQSCQSFQPPTSPLPVNGFNTGGFAKAESVYAGSDGTASLAHAGSAKAVSQYDVACFQASRH